MNGRPGIVVKATQVYLSFIELEQAETVLVSSRTSVSYLMNECNIFSTGNCFVLDGWPFVCPGSK